MYKRKWMIGLLLLLVSALWGCSGGENKGDSLDEQFQKAQGNEDPESRAKELVQVAYLQEKVANMQAAESSLDLAAKACGEISNIIQRVTNLNSVAYAQAEIGFLTDANEQLKEVRVLLDKIEDRQVKIAIIAKMVITLDFLNQKDTAQAYLQNAERQAAEMEEPSGRVSSLLDLANSSYRIKLDDEAQRLADEALLVARGIEDMRVRIMALSDVAAGVSRIKKDDQAEPIFAEAEQLASKIDNPLSRAHALADIAELQARSGRKDAARQMLSKAQDAADKSDDASLRNSLAERIQRIRNSL